MWPNSWQSMTLPQWSSHWGLVSHGDLLAVLAWRPTLERKAGKFNSSSTLKRTWEENYDEFDFLLSLLFTKWGCPTVEHKGCKNLHLSLGNLLQDLMQYITWEIYTIFPSLVLYIVSVTNLLLSGIEQAICCSSVRDDMWEINLKMLGSSPPRRHWSGGETADY